MLPRPVQGEVMAALAIELGAKSAAILYDGATTMSRGWPSMPKPLLKLPAARCPVYEAYTKNDTDFSAVLGKVADANVDVLFLPDYYNKVNLIAQQVKEKGIKATMIGGDGWDSPELDLNLMEGGYFSNHYSRLTRAKWCRISSRPTRKSTVRPLMHWPPWPMTPLKS